MPTLREHFTYDSDVDLNKVPQDFKVLSDKLEIIHSRHAVVRPLNSDTIDYGNLEFETIAKPINFEQEKEGNIVSLGKIMVGCYVSNQTGFRDFSDVKDDWFRANNDDVFEVFHYKDFDKEYFGPLFEGNIVYFSDYIDKKRQAEQLSGLSKSNNKVKMLHNPNIPTEYYANSDDSITYVEKNKSDIAARLHMVFNPLLIGISIAAISIIVTMIILLS